MNTSEKNTSTCANCGKGEEASIDLKSCAAYKLVKYCSRDCQIAHRPQHKKDCKKRAKELHDEKIFKQPPPLEDCPICMIRLPDYTKQTYMVCCGKNICCGCIYAVQIRDGGFGLCPFCRTPAPTSKEEIIKRYTKRVEYSDTDADAVSCLGSFYYHGRYGLRHNRAKALELWHRAAELGHVGAYTSIGRAYHDGHGVERDEKKAKHYFELGAMGGNIHARHNLGAMVSRSGNYDRALKHWMIAVRDGNPDSLECIKSMYICGKVTKDDYSKASRSYQAYLDEVKSDQRDEAAAAGSNSI